MEPMYECADSVFSKIVTDKTLDEYEHWSIYTSAVRSTDWMVDTQFFPQDVVVSGTSPVAFQLDVFRGDSDTQKCKQARIDPSCFNFFLF